MGDNRIFGADGYNQFGYDRDGYNREGYNSVGKNRYGFTKKQTEDILTHYSKVQKYGMTPIMMMKEYLNGPLISLPRFARDRNIDEKDLKKFRSLAEREDPDLKGLIKTKSEKANKQIVAIIRGDAEKVVAGTLAVEKFWANHEHVSINILRSMLGNTYLWHHLVQKFLFYVCDEHPEFLTGSNYLAKVKRVSAPCGADREDAIKSLQGYLNLQTNVSRGVKTRIWKVLNYLKSFDDEDYSKLLGQRSSFDGGKTWLVFDETLIAEVKEALKESGTSVCVRTVAEEAKRRFVASQEEKAS